MPRATSGLDVWKSVRFRPEIPAASREGPAWDGIIPALLAGKFDVIISGMSITPARNLTVNFSDPYAYSGVARRRPEPPRCPGR